jgi:hypothetical protein
VIRTYRHHQPKGEIEMGYAHYTVIRNGQEIEAGYTVPQVCDEPGCTEQIDRGLSGLCGETPGDPEHGCGRYFCDSHLYIDFEDESPQQCALCAGIENGDKPSETTDQTGAGDTAPAP